jgi:hypothetical protein
VSIEPTFVALPGCYRHCSWHERVRAVVVGLAAAMFLDVHSDLLCVHCETDGCSWVNSDRDVEDHLEALTV